MERVGGSLFFRRWSNLHLLFLLIFCSLQAESFAKSQYKRDPRQLTIVVSDLDGTITHNLGNYWLKRVVDPTSAHPFFNGLSGLPLEIAVPVNDFEGNTGPRIGKRIGHLGANGHFIPSTSLEPVELSNGQVIIPGYYYLDPTSFREFREPPPGQESYLLERLGEKIRSKRPFLLDGFRFLAIAMKKEYQDRMRAAILTMQGAHPRDMREFFLTLGKELDLGEVELAEEAVVNLHHHEFGEFSHSKSNYHQTLFDFLAKRVMQDHSTPHFLVHVENSREMIRETDKLFTRLANRGVLSNPVVPILVNMVEPEVFANPDGVDWDVIPMAEKTKMSRVTIYWPGRVERSNDLGRVLEVTLGLSPAEAKQMLLGQRSKYFCPHILKDEAEKGGVR